MRGPADGDLRTPLHTAIENNQPAGPLHMAFTLVPYSADLDLYTRP